MPVLCDTHVLIWSVLAPEKLSRKAVARLDVARAAGELACADISLWEMAMLLERGRVQSPLPTEDFVAKLCKALLLRIFPITPKIAAAAQSGSFSHGDPADRLIAATALAHNIELITADSELRRLRLVRTLW
ncbi:MAG TPA: type II toxin-antitoxin system VapC family toxin [Pseudomonadales bacterium]|jgi:PIN domain nuclease of toxin-antitoxin system|nr:type II toxin-antitoxin system VapC family toxin [Pseudomonadales bacterium]HRG51052.1 type II toxin-antitoxin system VapC family toxin [Pseudomonadales bacterium]